MKKIREKFNKRNSLFAIAVLSLIAVALILSGGVAGLLSVGGIALATIAPVALTDKEQAIVDKMKTDLQAEAEKLGKGYIKAEAFTETFNTMFASAMAKFNFEASKVKQVTDAVEATLKKYDLRKCNANYVRGINGGQG
jgi:hypothetical protein